MKRRKRDWGSEDFEMAPMIDMVFLLLVFFMTVSTMAQDARPEMELADSSFAKAKTDQVPGFVLSLSERKEGIQLFFEGKQIDVERLDTVIETAHKAEPELEWVVRAEKNLEWKEVEAILNRLRFVGVSKLRFATFTE